MIVVGDDLIKRITKRAHAKRREARPSEEDWGAFAVEIASIPTHEEAALFAETWAEEHARWLELKATYLTEGEIAAKCA